MSAFDESIIGASDRGLGAALGTGAGGLAAALSALRPRGPIERYTLAAFLPLVDLPGGARVPDNGPLALIHHHAQTVAALRTVGYRIWGNVNPEEIRCSAVSQDGWLCPDADELTSMIEARA